MWRRLANTGVIPTARSSHSLGVIGKKVYVFAGEKEPRVPVGNDLFAYDLEKNLWSKCEAKGDIPTPRVAHGSAVVDQKLYVFGGRTGIEMGEGLLDDLHYYDALENTWCVVDTKGEKPCGRSYHAMISANQKIYIFGGCSKDRHNDFFEFDVGNSCWTRLPTYDAIKPRGGPGLACVGRSIYVIAGFTGAEINDMHRFDLDTATWETLKPSPNIPPISVFGITTVGRKILLICGEVNPSTEGHSGAGSFSNDVYQYDTVAADKGWVKLEVTGNVPSPRGWLPAATTENGEVMIFGGNSTANDRLDDLYLFSL